MNEPTFFEKLKQGLAVFWKWLKPYLIKIHHTRKRIWKKYHIHKIFLLALLVVVLVTSIYLLYLAKSANVESLKAGLEQTTKVYDEKGEEAGSLYAQKGSFVTLDKIAPAIQDAVISTEDKRFYQHGGFDVRGIARAAVGYVVNRGNVVDGGSTLTQQLAKNAFLSQNQTLTRKAQELFLAVEIEKKYSKQDILEMYLNNAYFGNGVWGVEDAAQKYYGKHASEITTTEAASIAAILKSPSYYNPIDHMDHSIERRNLILDLMADNQKITKEEATEAKNLPLLLEDTYNPTDGYRYKYYFDAVIDEAVNKYDLKEEDIMNKGYKIYTALNQDYQQKMELTYQNNNLFQYSADGTLVQSGSVAMNPKNGGVYALVGGRGEHVFRGYNRATQIRVQPGSIMKPLAVYTPALESGYKIDSMLKDEKDSYGSDHYTPQNYNDVYLGEVPMYQAVANSINAPAVWLLDEIGVDKGYNKVEKFGIPLNEDDRYLGLALGGLTKGVSPLQMASAYTTFANEGKRADGHLITKIVDATGAIVVDNQNPKMTTVTTPEVAKDMTSMLMGVFNDGTGQNALPNGYTIAGKTGSTELTFGEKNGTKDQWIVGYTPDIVLSTWIGYDKTDEEHYLQGLSEEGVAPLFRSEMANILPLTPLTKFNTESAQNIVTEENKGSVDKWKDEIDKGAKYWGDKFKEGSSYLKEKSGNLFNKFKEKLN
ncbi:PBP1A family penicillin-binding protein [Carnobacterium divergens]|uniref:PBP1A family penicillin-binding protein n=1 Tax=Carnobacterium divergens TaxID=2748 RepID=UPI00128C7CFE|nr:PBP1A family penicillin-binding protein [Carnobacterium divergens]MPQ20984.1 PBP1A family penicillin-binding protein [Carnobacterium divergens]